MWPTYCCIILNLIPGPLLYPIGMDLNIGLLIRQISSFLSHKKYITDKIPHIWRYFSFRKMNLSPFLREHYWWLKQFPIISLQSVKEMISSLVPASHINSLKYQSKFEIYQMVLSPIFLDDNFKNKIKMALYFCRCWRCLDFSIAKVFRPFVSPFTSLIQEKLRDRSGDLLTQDLIRENH